MYYELTITMRLRSPRGPRRVANNFGSLWDYGTIRDSIADGLHLLNDPELVEVLIKKGPFGPGSDSANRFPQF
jgi:hypothetical protein